MAPMQQLVASSTANETDISAGCEPEQNRIAPEGHLIREGVQRRNCTPANPFWESKEGHCNGLAARLNEGIVEAIVCNQLRLRFLSNV